MAKTISILMLLAGLLLAAHTSARGDWITDGVPVCAAAGSQIGPLIAPDGSGGTIIVWEAFDGIYAQRIDSGGHALWAGDGVLMCAGSGNQNLNAVTPDGSGGAMLAWEDYRSGTWDIYAQRVDASGVVHWSLSGLPVCTAAITQYGARLAPDGAGGAVFAWHDNRDGVCDHIYAQRLNAAGAPLWALNGVALCTAANGQFALNLISDGAGGAIVAWTDMRLTPNYDIYVQRVDASGTARWTSNGLPVCTAANLQKYPDMASDGAGGAIIVWKDNRRGPDDLYAQRVDASGTARWTANGVPVCATGTAEKYHAVAADGAGGAIVAWPDSRLGTWDIYCQRLNNSGTAQWAANGIPVCTAAGTQDGPRIAADGFGGAVIAWQDARSGSRDIYAQRMNGIGGAQGPSNGFAVCTAAGDQASPAVTSDGFGGAVVAWQDMRGGIDYDIYARSTQACSVSPTSIDFGAVRCGAHRDTTFTIENTGYGTVILDVGESCACFNILSDEFVEYLGPGASTSLTVRYEPASTGAHACEIETGTACATVSCAGFGEPEVTGDDGPAVPQASFLAQNYPNPFSATTEIAFGLAQGGAVSLRIYDVAGHLVRELAGEHHAPGAYARVWDGKDSSGSPVPAGIYFYELKSGAFSQTRKMVRVR